MLLAREPATFYMEFIHMIFLRIYPERIKKGAGSRAKSMRELLCCI